MAPSRREHPRGSTALRRPLRGRGVAHGLVLCGRAGGHRRGRGGRHRRVVGHRLRWTRGGSRRLLATPIRRWTHRTFGQINGPPLKTHGRKEGDAQRAQSPATLLLWSGALMTTTTSTQATWSPRWEYSRLWTGPAARFSQLRPVSHRRRPHTPRGERPGLLIVDCGAGCCCFALEHGSCESRSSAFLPHRPRTPVMPRAGGVPSCPPLTSSLPPQTA
jgi:hypothetical protein